MNYSEVISVLSSNGYKVGKRIMNACFDEAIFMDVVVEVSPILLSDKVKEIATLLPGFEVTSEGTNSGVGRIAIVKK